MVVATDAMYCCMGEHVLTQVLQLPIGSHTVIAAAVAWDSRLCLAQATVAWRRHKQSKAQQLSIAPGALTKSIALEAPRCPKHIKARKMPYHLTATALSTHDSCHPIHQQHSLSKYVPNAKRTMPRKAQACICTDALLSSAPLAALNTHIHTINPYQNHPSASQICATGCMAALSPMLPGRPGLEGAKALPGPVLGRRPAVLIG